MFDKQFYTNKRQKLVNKMQVENNTTLQKIYNLMAELQQRQIDIQGEIAEIDKTIKENEPKENKDKESAKVDPKPAKS